MIPAENLRIALQGILANRLRSALTILGVLIGVASVILLVAVGTGSSTAIQSRINGLGTNLIDVSPQPTGFGPGGVTTAANLTPEDVAALQNRSANPDVRAVAPVLACSVTATWESTSYSPSSCIGTTSAYEQIGNYHIASGQFFTPQDERTHAPVAVIGQTVLAQLFHGQNAIGQPIQLNGATFQVIGVLRTKGTNGAQNQDDVVIAPLTAVEDFLSGYPSSYSRIAIEAVSPARESAAEAEITSTLDTTHHVTSSATADFQILNQATLLSASTTTTQTFTTLLAAVAAISLLVGGIGVMNIMLVTVTERTREIGIRKAVGARRRDLMGQFLVEAVLLSAIGGIVGVAAGLVGSHFQIAGVTPVVAPYSVVLALIVSVAVGLFFGLYPASRAANLQPIEALRRE